MSGRPGLWNDLHQAGFFRELESRISSDEGPTCLTGLVEGARALVLTRLAARHHGGILLVVPDDAAVESYRRDLAAVERLDGREPERIAVLPALDADPYDAIAPHPEVVRERVVALNRLSCGAFDVLIVPARALLNPLPSPEEWSRWTRTVAVGDSLPPDRFVLQTMGQGYRRVDIVSAPGEVSRRGGIVDVYPHELSEPVRIELFGDTVESLRAFDTDHQRSTGKLDSFTLGPAMENPPHEEALARLSRYLERGMQRAETEGLSVRPAREILELLQNQGYWPGFESLARLTSERPVFVFEHAASFLLVVDEPERTDDQLIRAAHDLEVSYEQSGNRTLPPPLELFGDPKEIRERLARPGLFLQELSGEEPAQAETVLHIPTRSSRNYAGRVQELVDDLRRTTEESRRTICVMRATGSAERLGEILNEYDLPSSTWEPASNGTPGGLTVAIGGLGHGFEFPELGLSVLTERDIFGEKRKVAGRKAGSRAAMISDFRDLNPGDTVVHIDHGIARFAGLGRPKGGSLNRDFMVLEFAQRDKLFVPVDRLDLVQKYSGVKGKKPQLDRLGGPGWERVKSKVRKAVESMARELLDLYARRMAATGHPFSADTPWQKELEDAFPFELTPDQERAVSDIKQDMESERTTDRLLVGDVGFGKTEVAVRAAFKAVVDGFQVALLAPTTVLAAQHFQTFRDRFEPFPARVEMVSRFRSAAETKKILADLAEGTVDVLIGTHRLLSKDVQFKRLGLLVVDEEQRFGVAHKERLKKMSIGVDVISMTATPIPRTLQMSLAGVRDLSVIETAPAGRTAIQSYVIPFRKNVLAQAIRQELRREGQVFVVHNRVDTLPAMVRAVQEMAPTARVVMAHGQMSERQLEAVMLKFTNYEADILVTTTIIENGLDIPRANTIIVNRADHFGLAQLYQLRGRVGRSREHAYAYFVVPSRQHLTSEARKRLQALQEFSELGAGFRLAAADLEIRGAGELLGSKQHGQIASLGFDLYCQMLENAVREMKGEPVKTTESVSLHLGVDIKIPQNFLLDSGDRLVIYKRLAQAETVEEVDRLQAETEDRYGHLPPPARNLFAMGRLRLLATEAGIKSIDLAEDKLQIRFIERPPVEPARVLALVQQEGGALTPSGMLTLPAPPRGSDRIQAAEDLVRQLL